jgi:hypothetical protein
MYPFATKAAPIGVAAKYAVDAALSIDTPVVAAAVSIPWWLPTIEAWGQALIVAGGVVLIILRVAIAARRLRAPAPERGDE